MNDEDTYGRNSYWIRIASRDRRGSPLDEHRREIPQAQMRSRPRSWHRLVEIEDCYRGCVALVRWAAS